MGMSSEKYKKVKEEEVEKERPHGAAALDSILDLILVTTACSAESELNAIIHGSHRLSPGFLLMGTRALSQRGNRGRPGEWYRGFVIGGGALNLRGALRVRW